MTTRESTLRKVAPAVVDADPFWAAVHREAPQVRLVLLPPPAASAAPPLSPDEALELVEAAATGWRLIRPLLAGAGAEGPPSVSWRGREGGMSFGFRKALIGIGQEAGDELLTRIAVDLGEAGWRLRPTIRDGRRVLRARDRADQHRVEVRAESGAGATVVTVATVPAQVRPTDRAALQAEVRSCL